MFLKHPNYLDIAVEVQKSYYIKENDTFSLKVVWWRMGKKLPSGYFTGNWPLTRPLRIRIKRDKLVEFVPVNNLSLKEGGYEK